MFVWITQKIFAIYVGNIHLSNSVETLQKSIQFAYKYYSDCKFGDQDKEWAPHVCCAPCNLMLSAWMNGKRKAMPFFVSEESTSDTETGEGDIYVPDADNSPHLFGPAELHDLVRDLELTKEKAELLGSRLS